MLTLLFMNKPLSRLSNTISSMLILPIKVVYKQIVVVRKFALTCPVFGFVEVTPCQAACTLAQLTTLAKNKFSISS